jgi:peptide/nickel transport system permease protein
MMIAPALLKDFIAFLIKDKLGLLGLLLIAGFIIIGVIAPYIVPYPEDAWGLTYNVERRLQPPSRAHPFGTDEYGRDVLSRVILASRFSLIIAISVVTLSLIIGVAVGLVAGYLGGWIGSTLMRVTDMFLAFPPLLLAIAFASILGRGLENVIIALSLSWWPWYARLTFVQVSSVKTMPYVDAAKIAGIPPLRILAKYILPNSLTPVTIQAFLDMGAAVLEAAALSFIGIGVKPPTPEWGLLISEGWILIGKAWWISLFPGIALFITVLGFNLLGDTYREYSNPKIRRLAEARV